MRLFSVIAAVALVLFMGMTTDSFAGEGWLTDMDAAQKLAVEKDLPILADFSGSDWCIWCVRLDKEVFSKAEFQEYAKENLVLLLIDFPRESEFSQETKDKNMALAQKYGVRGYPTVLLLDKEGEVLVRTGYRRGGAQEYVDYLKGLQVEKTEDEPQVQPQKQ